MKKVTVWLNQAQFDQLSRKAQRYKKSKYAYVKNLILEDIFSEFL